MTGGRRSPKLTTTAALAALAGAMCACGVRRAATGSEVGRVTVALTATAGTTIYALANATFAVTRIEPPPAPGDVPVRLRQADPTAGNLTTSLDVGRYTVTLLDGWQIEREDSPASLVAVEGTLLSANPVTVSVLSGRTTSLSFQFQTTEIPLTFGPGSIDIGIDISTCDPLPPAHPELNVIGNSDLEAGTEGWTGANGTLSLTDVPHCGRHSGMVAPAAGLNSWAGFVLPHPEIPTAYSFSAWVRSDAAGNTFLVRFSFRCNGAATDNFQLDTWFSPTSTDWQRVSSAIDSVGGPGCTDGTMWLVGSVNQALFFDDVYAIPSAPADTNPDTTPPDITIAGVTDGEFTNASAVVPVFTATDDHLSAVTATLDGSPFVSGAVVTTEGVHRLEVDAADVSGNRTARALSFTIDRTPPVLIVQSPAEGDRLNRLSFSAVGSASDDLSPVSVTVEGVPATFILEDWAVAVALAPGPNAVVVRAVDAAGNSNQQTIDVRANTVPPTLTVVTPAVGAVVTDATVAVEGLALSADPLDRVAVNVNGSVTQTSANGAFSSQVALSPGTNVISVTAVDGYQLQTQVTVTITRAAPPSPGLSATGAPFAAIQGVPSIPLVATLADGDVTRPASDYAAQIDWGDGTVTTGVITGAAGAFQVSGLHTYIGAGPSFVTTVSVSKRGAAPVSAMGAVTVDPAASTSGEATCTLGPTGALACWGDNSYGEASPPAGSYTGLTMTWYHGCALAADGTVACWGDDPSTPPAGAFTQVATGAAAQAHTCGLRPTGAVECWGDDNQGGSEPPPGTFILVTAGDGHACAMRPDHSVTCWGYLQRIYLPDNGAPRGTFRALTEGALHACGLHMDGTIECWGNNDLGQTAAPAGHFTSVVAGELTTCALKDDGSIVCWGYNNWGQSTPPPGTFRSLVPSAGYDQCAYRTDGALVCWGMNTSGQAVRPGGTFLGIGAEYARYCRIVPGGSASCFGQPSPAVVVPAAGPFTALTSGAYHTCGLRQDQTVACWGDNSSMQSAAPAGVFTDISAGWAHTCGVRTDGTLVCWGYDFFGQSTPPAGTFKAVAAGGYFSCGIRSDGTLVCWGNGDNGQTLAPSGSFTAVTGGMRHACGIRASDGSVACWGDNVAGQRAALPGPFLSIAAGELYTCGIHTNGSVACWGDNAYGVATPPTGIFAVIATRRSFACGLHPDGTETCWGATVR